jgi:RimJ/RimL family protein N-acetyltransferase
MTDSLRTPRLILRRWLPEDRVPFAAMNADPRVMQFFPAPLTPDESDNLLARIEAHFDQHGFGLWAVEVPGTASFAGFIGLSTPRFDAPFTPCVEIGWRLAARYWNLGFATEGARAALSYGFEVLKLNEILAFTVPDNVRSLRVMEKIGMAPIGEFDHPLVSDGCRLKRHVLYRTVHPPRTTAASQSARP